MYKVSAKPVKKIYIDKIQQIYRRRYELREIGLELIVEGKKHTQYFAFNQSEEMDEIYKQLIRKISQEATVEVYILYTNNLGINGKDYVSMAIRVDI